MSSLPLNPWWHRQAVLTAVATLGLICVGGLVTSHGAGMAVPDWPNTYGYNLFLFSFSKWVGGIFYEHTHRLAGALVGLLTLALALGMHGRSAASVLRWGSGLLLVAGLLAWAARALAADSSLLVAGLGALGLGISCVSPRGDPAPRHLRLLALAVLAGVVGQGIVGGLRVVLLKDQIGIVHAALAQLLFVLIGVIALVSGPRWQALSARAGGR